MAKMIKVGMADLNICHTPDAITTLGSCVGVALYDKTTKIAGLVHVMLPDSTKVRQNQNRAKFADTGIDYLIELLEKEGARKSSLTAKIAGGAQMFAFSSNNDMLRVGERNVEAVKEKLKSIGIRILAEDTGLNYGRTVEFYPETGDFVIKSVVEVTRALEILLATLILFYIIGCLVRRLIERVLISNSVLRKEIDKQTDEDIEAEDKEESDKDVSESETEKTDLLR